MIYTIFMVVWVIAVLIIYNGITVRNNPEINTQKFKKEFYNEMYLMSFGIPFKWFVDDDDNPTEEKTKKLKKDLELAGFDQHFTLRSFMTFKVIIMMAFLLLGGLILFIMKNAHHFSKIFFNVEVAEQPLGIQTSLLVISICLFFALMPNLILKQKVKKKMKEDSKDIPVLQMFIILMLRSNKTIAEILYALSRVNTPHKKAFEKGYRIYLRNKGEGMSFLKEHFYGTRFVETFNLLEDIGEYAREECIRILENNLQSLVEETNTIKRRADLSKLIYSQASMIIPFTSILLLGAFPLVMMGLEIFTSAFSGAGL